MLLPGSQPKDEQNQDDQSWYSLTPIRSLILQTAILIIISGGTIGFSRAREEAPEVKSFRDEIRANFSTKGETQDIWRYVNEMKARRDKQIESLATKEDIEHIKEIILLIKENTDEIRKLEREIKERR